MIRLNVLLVSAVSVLFLAGCSVTLDVNPPWHQSHLHLHPSIEEDITSPATPTATATASLGETANVPETKPIHLLDIRPVTATASFSLTNLLDLDVHSVGFADGCNVNQALGKVSSFDDSIVIAAISHISGTVPFSSAGERNRAAFSPNVERKLYWSSASGPADPFCTPNLWLWQELVIFPKQSDPTASKPALISLPATSACEFTEGFTVGSFGSLMIEKNEWPDLLYVLNPDDKTSLLMLQQASCESGAGCTVVRNVCQSLFEEGEWLEWCTSLCSG